MKRADSGGIRLVRENGGGGTPPSPTPPSPPIVIPTTGLPTPVLKVTMAGVLGKICGEANEVVFIGLTDLFQSIADFFIPNIWPLTMLEAFFNDVFDNLQENLKPFAYNQGVEMGSQMEAKVNAWIKSQFDIAKAQIDNLKNQALGEINTAKKELEEHAAKIESLLDRVATLEGKSKPAFPTTFPTTFGGIKLG